MISGRAWVFALLGLAGCPTECQPGHCTSVKSNPCDGFCERAMATGCTQSECKDCADDTIDSCKSQDVCEDEYNDCVQSVMARDAGVCEQDALLHCITSNCKHEAPEVCGPVGYPGGEICQQLKAAREKKCGSSIAGFGCKATRTERHACAENDAGCIGFTPGLDMLVKDRGLKGYCRFAWDACLRHYRDAADCESAEDILRSSCRSLCTAFP